MSTQADPIQSESGYDAVKDYYGQVLQKSTDLKTDACCTPEKVPAHIKEVLPLVSSEIKKKYYGCGSPIPLCLAGLRVLDLGCGTGRDCYVMSKLVGKDGFVYGMDMTENQIAVARRHIAGQTDAFGYSKPNVSFVYDYIENLREHFEAESLDLVASNCVINLTDDKEEILRQVHDVLKFGGEMYFADIYADRRVPEKISKDPVVRGECLGGALYYTDLERIARKVGFADPRVVTRRAVSIRNKEIESIVGNIDFYSITYRLWKIKGLEDACEDYGHTAVYTGQLPGCPFRFELDSGHVFEKNRPERICGNTALMLTQTRLKGYFEVQGSFKKHFGAFENCATSAQKSSAVEAPDSGCC
jgi:SAM-dependent methyltransferase